MQKHFRLTLTFVALIFVVLNFSSPCRAEDAPNQCAPALEHYNKTVLDLSHQAQMAWLRTINIDNYEQSKQEGSASLSDLFKGSYSNFDTKRNKLLSENNFSLSTSESIHSVLIELPPAAYTAYSDCMKLFSKGFFYSIKHIDASGATIVLSWWPAQGLENMRNISVELSGEKVGKLNRLTSLSPGEKSFLVERFATNSAVRGVINGTAGSTSIPGNYTVDFYLPALQSPVSALEPTTSVQGVWYCELRNAGNVYGETISFVNGVDGPSSFTGSGKFTKTPPGSTSMNVETRYDPGTFGANNEVVWKRSFNGAIWEAWFYGAMSQDGMSITGILETRKPSLAIIPFPMDKMRCERRK